MGSSAYAQDTEMTGNLEGTVRIGALVPVSGDASAHGTEIKITIDLAESDFNDYLAENGVNWRLDIVVEDTASSPVIALDKVSGLKAKGITAIVGTYSSSELRNIKGYTEPNDMLLLSYGSTAPSLSLAGDNIFRFVPDETKQAPAIVQYLTGIGVTNLVPIWRGDAWGDGFIDAVRSEMTAAGGATGEGVRYHPEALEFSTEIAILADQVKPLIDEVGADKVAIMVVTFSEVTPIMQTASQYESLSQVLWLGTDTIVNDGEFSGDAIAQEFVNKAGLVVTSYAPASTTISEEISERAMEITGQAPNIYAITAYDVVWALGLSILAADSTETDAIVSAMPGVLEDYSGGLGSIVLNDAGDMGVAVYNIFTVRDSQWTLIGSYDSATDSLVLEDAMMDDKMMKDKLSGEIRLGLITPLSGDVAQYGEENLAATNLAVDDFNKYLADKDAGWSIELTIEDSQTLPTAALEKIQSLRAKGISIVLGPWSSASLQNVKGYADSNEMLLFSCCSTSPLIAISGDSVFRMSPDDSNQGTAISKLFDDAGIEVMVPVWREDAWGTGLQDASRLSFESRGGIVDDGLGYNPEVSEFSVEASILADTVQGYVNDHGADKVGVLYVGFGEVLLFMQAASDYEVLGDVRWFGSDANTKESKLVEDSIGLGFVTDTMYTTVQVASGKNDLSQYVDSSLNESIGRIPSTYASSAYDMMWLMGLTIEREQSTDVAVLTAAIPEVAEEYVGALGSSRLNDAGDLAQTNYDVWDIRDGSWTLAGTYFSATDTIALEGAMMDDAMKDDEMMDDETDEATPSGGGCLIATAAYGSELAPQVQFLREIRDNTLLSTASGTSFMTGFNQFYYSFSPAVADLERENAVFRDAVRVAITPALYTLNIMTLADQNSDSSVLAFGLLAIAAMAGIYIAGPLLATRAIVRKIKTAR